MTIKELEQKVIEWASERGIETGDGKQQSLYLASEQGELFDAVLKDKHDAILDAIGDMLVVTIILAKQLGISIDWGHYDCYHLEGYKRLEIGKWLSRIQNTTNEINRQLSEYYLSFERNHGVALEVNELVSELSLVAVRYQSSIEECLSLAYDVIRKRKGKTVNGVFIKEG